MHPNYGHQLPKHLQKTWITEKLTTERNIHSEEHLVKNEKKKSMSFYNRYKRAFLSEMTFAHPHHYMTFPHGIDQRF